MASLSFCSFACSTGSGNRSSRQIPASGITRSPSVTSVRLAVTKSEGALGSKIARRRRDEHTIHHEVVQRDVVPTEPPAPQPFATRLAEHPQVVQPSITAAFPVEA